MRICADCFHATKGDSLTGQDWLCSKPGLIINPVTGRLRKALCSQKNSQGTCNDFSAMYRYGKFPKAVLGGWEYEIPTRS